MNEPARSPERLTVTAGSDVLTGYRYGSSTGPAIILCTGFSGTQDTPSIRAAAEHFAAAGIQSFTFDYSTFGESSGGPRQIISVPRQLRDIRALITHVRSLPTVDPDRIALWGSSLGGGHVITIGASDPRIAAIVAQVPFNGVARRVEGRPTRVSLGLLWTAVKDKVRGWFRLRPLYVKAVGGLEERAVMVSRRAQNLIGAMDSRSWSNIVAPRGLLDMAVYRPGRAVHRLACPLLVCTAREDTEIPAELTDELAARAACGKQISYDVSHFDIYLPEIRQRVLRDQAEFLSAALGRN